MKTKQRRNLFSRVFSSLRDLFTRSWQRRQTDFRFRPFLECLESRVAPAVLSQSPGVNQLVITLNNPGEKVQLTANAGNTITITDSVTNGLVNSGTNPVSAGNFTGTFPATSNTINSTGVSAYTGGIEIVDGGASGASDGQVEFDEGAGVFLDSVTVNLTNGDSGDITFVGTGSVRFGASATTVANLSASTAGGAITAASPSTALELLDGNLSLSALAARGINLQGIVSVVNATTPPTTSFTLTGNGTAGIMVSNSDNSFGTSMGGSVNMTTQGGVADLVAGTGMGTLRLGNITTNGGNLDLSANDFAQAANTSINDTNSTTSGATLAGVTGGLASFTATGATGSAIVLGNANNFAQFAEVTGGVTGVTLSRSNPGNVTFRNINVFAALPTGLPTSNPGFDLNLTFDNAAIALPTINVDTLEVSSGGAGGITQQASTTLTVSSISSFTVTNDAQITLNNIGNSFSGAVSFQSSVSDQNVFLANTVATVLGTSSLGRGLFSVSSTGDIMETGAIVQAKAAGTAIFSTTAGTTINLITQANDFTGQVVAAGASVTTFDLRNTDELAQFANLTFSASVTTLSVEFDNAPILVGNLSIPTLTLNSAFGIFQNTGTSITAATLLRLIDTVGATATPILLSNANDITNVNVNTTANTGNVIINNGANNLNFMGPNSIGPGRLVVTAANITQTDGSSITTSGRASFTSSGSISLDQTGNSFGGQVDASVTGSNNLTIGQGSGTLLLGDISIGTGQLNVNTNADASGIAQAAGTNIVTGAGSTSVFGNFFAGKTIALTNFSTNPALGNQFGGSVSLNTTSSASAAITSSGALQLAGGMVGFAGGGALTVLAGGAITQSNVLLTVFGPASFNAGTSGITLTSTFNHFLGDVNLTSTGAAAVQLSANTTVTLGTVTLGSGIFTVSTTGDIVEDVTAGGLTQAGAGAISLASGSANNITLNNSKNNFLGTVTVPGGGTTNVNLVNRGDLALMALAALGGSLSLTAGGTVTLPTTSLTGLTGLSVSAHSTTVSSNITASGGISFTGGVTFSGGRSPWPPPTTTSSSSPTSPWPRAHRSPSSWGPA